MKASRVVKHIALTLSVVYFATNCAFAHLPETTLWHERRTAQPKPKPIQLAALPTAFSLPASGQVLNQITNRPDAALPSSFLSTLRKKGVRNDLDVYAALFNALPGNVGSIRSVQTPPQGDARRVLVHIQDVHLNQEVQRNIGKAVASLIANKKAEFIGLEGAFAPIDLKNFRSHPDKKVIAGVADFMLKKNEISGPVHAAITAASTFPEFTGVDDASHYKKNVAAFVRSSQLIETLKKRVEKAAKALSEQKKTILNRELAEFEAHVEAYRAGQTSLGDYIRYLAKISPAISTDLAAFIEALSIEESLDFPAVEAERSRIISRLMKNLTAEETEDLLNQSVAYRLGGLRHGDFYQRLKTLCRRHGVSLTAYKNMNDYIQYVLLSENIDAEKLFSEVSELEESGYATLGQTYEEKELLKRGKYLYLTGKLVDFSLTSEEWKTYLSLKLQTANSKFQTNFKNQKTNVLIFGNSDIAWDLGFGDWDLKSFEQFYEEAEARDAAMASNVIKGMNQTGAKVGVLITGGFHSKGMLPLFRSAGVAVVNFVPKISKVEMESGVAALSVFTQEKTPLEKIFQGEKLFLAGNPANFALAPFRILAKETHDAGVAEGEVVLPLPTGSVKVDVQKTGDTVIEEIETREGDVVVTNKFDASGAFVSETISGPHPTLATVASDIGELPVKAASLTAHIFNGRLRLVLNGWLTYLHIPLRLAFAPAIVPYQTAHLVTGPPYGRRSDYGGVRLAIRIFSGMPWEVRGAEALHGLITNALIVAALSFLKTSGFFEWGFSFSWNGLWTWFFLSNFVFLLSKLLLTGFAKRLGLDRSADLLQAFKKTEKNPFDDQIIKAAKHEKLTGEETQKLLKPEHVYEFDTYLVPDDANAGMEVLWSARVQHGDGPEPYKGGTRYAPHLNLDTLRLLAGEMWSKVKNSNLPYNGGKGGVAIKERKYSPAEHARITRNYTLGLMERDIIGHNKDIPASDIGTDETTMAYMLDEIIRYQIAVGRLDRGLFSEDVFIPTLDQIRDRRRMAKIYAQSPDRGESLTLTREYMRLFSQGRVDGKLLAYVTGKPEEFGGLRARKDSTGYGAFYFVERLLERKYEAAGEKTKGVQGHSFGVQGMGNAGGPFIEAVINNGGRVLAIGESFLRDGNRVGVVFRSKNGFTHNQYNALRNYGLTHKTFEGFSFPGIEVSFGEPGVNALFDERIEFAVPAALGGVINESNVDRFAQAKHLRAIFEIANGPVTVKAEMRLRELGIENFPDVRVNAGGVTGSYYEWLNNLEELQDAQYEGVLSRLRNHMRQLADSLLDLAEQEQVEFREMAGIVAIKKWKESRRNDRQPPANEAEVDLTPRVTSKDDSGIGLGSLRLTGFISDLNAFPEIISTGLVVLLALAGTVSSVSTVLLLLTGPLAVRLIWNVSEFLIHEGGHILARKKTDGLSIRMQAAQLSARLDWNYLRRSLFYFQPIDTPLLTITDYALSPTDSTPGATTLQALSGPAANFLAAAVSLWLLVSSRFVHQSPALQFALLALLVMNLIFLVTSLSDFASAWEGFAPYGLACGILRIMAPLTDRWQRERFEDLFEGRAAVVNSLRRLPAPQKESPDAFYERLLRQRLAKPNVEEARPALVEQFNQFLAQEGFDIEQGVREAMFERVERLIDVGARLRSNEDRKKLLTERFEKQLTTLSKWLAGFGSHGAGVSLQVYDPKTKQMQFIDVKLTPGQDQFPLFNQRSGRTVLVEELMKAFNVAIAYAEKKGYVLGDRVHITGHFRLKTSGGVLEEVTTQPFHIGLGQWVKIWSVENGRATVQLIPYEAYGAANGDFDNGRIPGQPDGLWVPQEEWGRFFEDLFGKMVGANDSEKAVYFMYFLRTQGILENSFRLGYLSAFLKAKMVNGKVRLPSKSEMPSDEWLSLWAHNLEPLVKRYLPAIKEGDENARKEFIAEARVVLRKVQGLSNTPQGAFDHFVNYSLDAFLDNDAYKAAKVMMKHVDPGSTYGMFFESQAEPDKTIFISSLQPVTFLQDQETGAMYTASSLAYSMMALLDDDMYDPSHQVRDLYLDMKRGSNGKGGEIVESDNVNNRLKIFRLETEEELTPQKTEERWSDATDDIKELKSYQVPEVFEDPVENEARVAPLYVSKRLREQFRDAQPGQYARVDVVDDLAQEVVKTADVHDQVNEATQKEGIVYPTRRAAPDFLIVAFREENLGMANYLQELLGNTFNPEGVKVINAAEHMIDIGKIGIDERTNVIILDNYTANFSNTRTAEDFERRAQYHERKNAAAENAELERVLKEKKARMKATWRAIAYFRDRHPGNVFVMTPLKKSNISMAFDEKRRKVFDTTHFTNVDGSIGMAWSQMVASIELYLRVVEKVRAKYPDEEPTAPMGMTLTQHDIDNLKKAYAYMLEVELPDILGMKLVPHVNEKGETEWKAEPHRSQRRKKLEQVAENLESYYSETVRVLILSITHLAVSILIFGTIFHLAFEIPLYFGGFGYGGPAVLVLILNRVFDLVLFVFFGLGTARLVRRVENRETDDRLGAPALIFGDDFTHNIIHSIVGRQWGMAKGMVQPPAIYSARQSFDLEGKYGHLSVRGSKLLISVYPRMKGVRYTRVLHETARFVKRQVESFANTVFKGKSVGPLVMGVVDMKEDPTDPSGFAFREGMVFNLYTEAKTKLHDSFFNLSMDELLDLIFSGSPQGNLIAKRINAAAGKAVVTEATDEVRDAVKKILLRNETLLREAHRIANPNAFDDPEKSGQLLNLVANVPMFMMSNLQMLEHTNRKLSNKHLDESLPVVYRAIWRLFKLYWHRQDTQNSLNVTTRIVEGPDATWESGQKSTIRSIDLVANSRRYHMDLPERNEPPAAKAPVKTKTPASLLKVGRPKNSVLNTPIIAVTFATILVNPALGFFLLLIVVLISVQAAHGGWWKIIFGMVTGDETPATKRKSKPSPQRFVPTLEQEEERVVPAGPTIVDLAGAHVHVLSEPVSNGFDTKVDLNSPVAKTVEHGVWLTVPPANAFAVPLNEYNAPLETEGTEGDAVVFVNEMKLVRQTEASFVNQYGQQVKITRIDAYGADSENKIVLTDFTYIEDVGGKIKIFKAHVIAYDEADRPLEAVSDEGRVVFSYQTDEQGRVIGSTEEIYFSKDGHVPNPQDIIWGNLKPDRTLKYDYTKDTASTGMGILKEISVKDGESILNVHITRLRVFTDGGSEEDPGEEKEPVSASNQTASAAPAPVLIVAQTDDGQARAASQAVTLGSGGSNENEPEEDGISPDAVPRVQRPVPGDGAPNAGDLALAPEIIDPELVQARADGALIPFENQPDQNQVLPLNLAALGPLLNDETTRWMQHADKGAIAAAIAAALYLVWKNSRSKTPAQLPPDTTPPAPPPTLETTVPPSPVAADGSDGTDDPSTRAPPAAENNVRNLALLALLFSFCYVLAVYALPWAHHALILAQPQLGYAAWSFTAFQASFFGVLAWLIFFIGNVSLVLTMVVIAFHFFARVPVTKNILAWADKRVKGFVEKTKTQTGWKKWTRHYLVEAPIETMYGFGFKIPNDGIRAFLAHRNPDGRSLFASIVVWVLLFVWTPFKIAFLYIGSRLPMLVIGTLGRWLLLAALVYALPAASASWFINLNILNIFLGADVVHALILQGGVTAAALQLFSPFALISSFVIALIYIPAKRKIWGAKPGTTAGKEIWDFAIGMHFIGFKIAAVLYLLSFLPVAVEAIGHKIESPHEASVLSAGHGLADSFLKPHGVTLGDLPLFGSGWTMNSITALHWNAAALALADADRAENERAALAQQVGQGRERLQGLERDQAQNERVIAAARGEITRLEGALAAARADVVRLTQAAEAARNPAELRALREREQQARAHLEGQEMDFARESMRLGNELHELHQRAETARAQLAEARARVAATEAVLARPIYPAALEAQLRDQTGAERTRLIRNYYRENHGRGAVSWLRWWTEQRDAVASDISSIPSSWKEYKANLTDGAGVAHSIRGSGTTFSNTYVRLTAENIVRVTSLSSLSAETLKEMNVEIGRNGRYRVPIGTNHIYEMQGHELVLPVSGGSNPGLHLVRPGTHFMDLRADSVVRASTAAREREVEIRTGLVTDRRAVRTLNQTIEQSRERMAEINSTLAMEQARLERLQTELAALTAQRERMATEKGKDAGRILVDTAPIRQRIDQLQRELARVRSNLEWAEKNKRETADRIIAAQQGIAGAAQRQANLPVLPRPQDNPPPAGAGAGDDGKTADPFFFFGKTSPAVLVGAGGIAGMAFMLLMVLLVSKVVKKRPAVEKRLPSAFEPGTDDPRPTAPTRTTPPVVSPASQNGDSQGASEPALTLDQSSALIDPNEAARILRILDIIDQYREMIVNGEPLPPFIDGQPHVREALEQLAVLPTPHAIAVLVSAALENGRIGPGPDSPALSGQNDLDPQSLTGPVALLVLPEQDAGVLPQQFQNAGSELPTEFPGVADESQVNESHFGGTNAIPPFPFSLSTTYRPDDFGTKEDTPKEPQKRAPKRTLPEGLNVYVEEEGSRLTIIVPGNEWSLSKGDDNFEFKDEKRELIFQWNSRRGVYEWSAGVSSPVLLHATIHETLDQLIIAPLNGYQLRYGASAQTNVTIRLKDPKHAPLIRALPHAGYSVPDDPLLDFDSSWRNDFLRRVRQAITAGDEETGLNEIENLAQELFTFIAGELVSEDAQRLGINPEEIETGVLLLIADALPHVRMLDERGDGITSLLNAQRKEAVDELSGIIHRLLRRRATERQDLDRILKALQFLRFSLNTRFYSIVDHVMSDAVELALRPDPIISYNPIDEQPAPLPDEAITVSENGLELTALIQGRARSLVLKNGAEDAVLELEDVFELTFVWNEERSRAAGRPVYLCVSPDPEQEINLIATYHASEWNVVISAEKPLYVRDIGEEAILSIILVDRQNADRIVLGTLVNRPASQPGVAPHVPSSPAVETAAAAPAPRNYGRLFKFVALVAMMFLLLALIYSINLPWFINAVRAALAAKWFPSALGDTLFWGVVLISGAWAAKQIGRGQASGTWNETARRWVLRGLLIGLFAAFGQLLLWLSTPLVIGLLFGFIIVGYVIMTRVIPLLWGHFWTFLRIPFNWLFQLSPKTAYKHSLGQSIAVLVLITAGLFGLYRASSMFLVDSSTRFQSTVNNVAHVLWKMDEPKADRPIDEKDKTPKAPKAFSKTYRGIPLIQGSDADNITVPVLAPVSSPKASLDPKSGIDPKQFGKPGAVFKTAAGHPLFLLDLPVANAEAKGRENYKNALNDVQNTYRRGGLYLKGAASKNEELQREAEILARAYDAYDALQAKKVYGQIPVPGDVGEKDEKGDYKPGRSPEVMYVVRGLRSLGTVTPKQKMADVHSERRATLRFVISMADFQQNDIMKMHLMITYGGVTQRADVIRLSWEATMRGEVVVTASVQAAGKIFEIKEGSVAPEEIEYEVVLQPMVRAPLYSSRPFNDSATAKTFTMAGDHIELPVYPTTVAGRFKAGEKEVTWVLDNKTVGGIDPQDLAYLEGLAVKSERFGKEVDAYLKQLKRLIAMRAVGIYPNETRLYTETVNRINESLSKFGLATFKAPNTGVLTRVLNSVNQATIYDHPIATVVTPQVLTTVSFSESYKVAPNQIVILRRPSTGQETLGIVWELDPAPVNQAKGEDQSKRKKYIIETYNDPNRLWISNGEALQVICPTDANDQKWLKARYNIWLQQLERAYSPANLKHLPRTYPARMIPTPAGLTAAILREMQRPASQNAAAPPLAAPKAELELPELLEREQIGEKRLGAIHPKDDFRVVQVLDTNDGQKRREFMRLLLKDTKINTQDKLSMVSGIIERGHSDAAQMGLNYLRDERQILALITLHKRLLAVSKDLDRTKLSRRHVLQLIEMGAPMKGEDPLQQMVKANSQLEVREFAETILCLDNAAFDMKTRRALWRLLESNFWKGYDSKLVLANVLDDMGQKNGATILRRYVRVIASRHVGWELGASQKAAKDNHQVGWHDPAAADRLKNMATTEEEDRLYLFHSPYVLGNQDLKSVIGPELYEKGEKVYGEWAAAANARFEQLKKEAAEKKIPMAAVLDIASAHGDNVGGDHIFNRLDPLSQLEDHLSTLDIYALERFIYMAEQPGKNHYRARVEDALDIIMRAPDDMKPRLILARIVVNSKLPDVIPYLLGKQFDSRLVGEVTRLREMMRERQPESLAGDSGDYLAALAKLAGSFPQNKTYEQRRMLVVRSAWELVSDSELPRLLVTDKNSRHELREALVKAKVPENIIDQLVEEEINRMATLWAIPEAKHWAASYYNIGSQRHTEVDSILENLRIELSRENYNHERVVDQWNLLKKNYPHAHARLLNAMEYRKQQIKNGPARDVPTPGETHRFPIALIGTIIGGFIGFFYLLFFAFVKKPVPASAADSLPWYRRPLQWTRSLFTSAILIAALSLANGQAQGAVFNSAPAPNPAPVQTVPLSKEQKVLETLPAVQSFGLSQLANVIGAARADSAYDSAVNVWEIQDKKGAQLAGRAISNMERNRRRTHDEAYVFLARAAGVKKALENLKKELERSHPGVLIVIVSQENAPAADFAAALETAFNPNRAGYDPRLKKFAAALRLKKANLDLFALTRDWRSSSTIFLDGETVASSDLLAHSSLYLIDVINGLVSSAPANLGVEKTLETLRRAKDHIDSAA